MPLSAIHRLLRTGAVFVDGKASAASCRVRTGQTITVDFSYAEDSPRRAQARSSGAQARSTDESALEILYEGNGLLAVNKPAGLAVHGPCIGKSLEETVREYLEPKLIPSLSFRPGPLHRLDRPSSGLIFFSTSLEGARFFSSLMRERKIKKYYLALLEGVIEKDEIWEDELSRDKKTMKTVRAAKTLASSDEKKERPKPALTSIKPLLQNDKCSLVMAEIETGRTHQIRAQAAGHGHPLLGDKKYGGKALNRSSGFMLHAWRLEFPSAIPLQVFNLQVPRVIEAPVPKAFLEKIKEMFGDEKSRIIIQEEKI